MAGACLFYNDAGSTLASNISSSTTTIQLSPGGGAQFSPAPGAGQFFVMTLLDAATGSFEEIVHVTQVVTDTLTVVRAQEGTAARAYLAGDFIANWNTAGQMAGFAQSSATNSIVTISTATYSSYTSNIGQTVERGYSGTMVDTLPAANSSLAGSVISIANQSAGTAGILVIGPGAGSTIYSPQYAYGGAAHQWVYLSFGQGCTLYTPDGTNWVTFQCPNRMRSEAGITVYCDSATGNDTNHGMLSTAPVQHITTAALLAQALIDAASTQITIQLFASSYVGNNAITGGVVGQALTTLNYGVNGAGGATAPPLSQMGALILQGPASGTAVLSASSGPAVVRCGGQSSVVINGAIEITSTGTFTAGLLIDPGANVAIGNGPIFGACSGPQIWCAGTGYGAGNYSIIGGSSSHILCSGSGARFNYSPVTVTITGSPSFSGGWFLNVSVCGSLYTENVTWSGGISAGQKYAAVTAGGINSNGSLTSIPGTSQTVTSPGWAV